MDARLLTGIEEKPYKEMPDLSAQPSLTNPSAAMPVEAGPVGARLLAGGPPPGMPRQMPAPAAAPLAAPAAMPPAAMAPATAPAATLAQPQPTAKPQRSAEDQKLQTMIDRTVQTASKIKQINEQRRAYRSDMKQYGGLMNKMETASSQLKDAEEFEKNFGPALADKPDAMLQLQLRQAKHLTALKRLREDQKKKAQELSKKYGLKLGADGGLDNPDLHEEDTNRAYDNYLGQGYVDTVLPGE